MSKKDEASKLFFRQREIVADLFNAHLFNGEKRLFPEEIQEKNTEYPGTAIVNDKTVPGLRIRDLLFNANMFTDGETDYLVLGIELQTYDCPDMVLRLMEYDTREYIKQYNETKGPINPIVNVVVNLSLKKWRSPISLSDFFPRRQNHPIKYINDYNIHVLEIEDLYEKRNLMTCDKFKAVINFLRNQENLNALLKELENDTPDLTLGYPEIMLLNSLLQCDIHLTENEEEITMCKAIEDLMERGRVKGLTEGKAEGRMEEKYSMARKMLQYNFSWEDIFKLTGFSAGELRKIAAEMKS